MKVDFSKVSINATVEGDPVVIDLTKEVGNLVYGRTADIAVSDFGKKITTARKLSMFRDLWLRPSRISSWDHPLSPP